MSSDDGTDAPSALSVIRLVAAREIGERLRAKSFYFLTAALVLVILAVGVIARLTGGDDAPDALEIGIVEPVAAELEAAVVDVAGAFDREVEVVRYDDVTTGRSALEDGDLDALLVPAETEAVFSDTVDQLTFAVLQQAWSGTEMRAALADGGLADDEIAAALSPTPLTSTTLDGGDGTDGLAVLTGTLAAILLFVSLQTFGGYVLMGVVEEKSTAVIEVLLVRARPDQLLAGKVIGIGTAALVQFALAVVAGIVSLAISGVEVPSAIWSAVPMTIVWFLGGYALYSTLFALAGSLVSRQEDAQAAAAPIMTALIGAYMVIFIVGYVPESTVSRVLSIIPPIAPLLMPMRQAAGAAAAWEVGLALVLLLATVWGAWKLAGRIYEQVLLQRGSRIGWRDAVGLLRRG